MAERRDRSPRPGDFSVETKDAIIARQTKKSGRRGEEMHTLYCALCGDKIDFDPTNGINKGEDHHVMGLKIGTALGIDPKDLSQPENGVTVHGRNTPQACHRLLDEAQERGVDYHELVLRERHRGSRRGRDIIEAFGPKTRRLTRGGRWVPVNYHDISFA